MKQDIEKAIEALVEEYRELNERIAGYMSGVGEECRDHTEVARMRERRREIEDAAASLRYSMRTVETVLTRKAERDGTPERREVFVACSSGAQLALFRQKCGLAPDEVVLVGHAEKLKGWRYPGKIHVLPVGRMEPSAEPFRNCWTAAGKPSMSPRINWIRERLNSDGKV